MSLLRGCVWGEVSPVSYAYGYASVVPCETLKYDIKQSSEIQHSGLLRASQRREGNLLTVYRPSFGLNGRVAGGGSMVAYYGNSFVSDYGVQSAEKSIKRTGIHIVTCATKIKSC